MSFKAQLTGRRSSRRTLDKYRQLGPQAVNDYVEMMGEKILGYANSSMANEPKTGRVYETDRGIHQASAPGEAPAVFSGLLINSGYVNIRWLNQYSVRAEVGYSSPYAYELEFFGPDFNGQPRPFLQPAIDVAEQEAGGTLLDAWSRIA